MIIQGDPDADWPDGFDAPDDGDDEDAESVDVALEALADRTAILKALRHEETIFTWLRYAQFDSTKWQVDIDIAASGVGTWKNLTTGAEIIFPLVTPHNATLIDLLAYIAPDTTHAGLPSGKPFWTLYEIAALAGGTATNILNAVDAPANLAAYEAPHSFGHIGQSITLDQSSKMYFVKFHAESGTNYKQGLRIRGIRAKYSVLNLDGGGAR